MLKGTVGDAGFNPELTEILGFLGDKNTYLHTNGSNRNTDWWKSIARKNLITRFCLDGVDQDTHHIYRKTDFNRVLGNARAYISAGGRAEWFFIIFRHNQHQLEEASKLAKDFGFESFTAIYSDRYEQSTNTESPIGFNIDLQHVSWQTQEPFEWSGGEIKLENFYGDSVSKLDGCYNLRNNTAYIAADGTVWPCCYYGSSNLTQNDIIWKLYKNKVLEGDINRMNINHRSIEDITKDLSWLWWDEYVKVHNPKKCQQYCGSQSERK